MCSDETARNHPEASNPDRPHDSSCARDGKAALNAVDDHQRQTGGVMDAAKTDRERALEYCERLKNPEFVALTFDDLFGHAPFKPDWAYIEPEEKDLT